MDSPRVVGGQEAAQLALLGHGLRQDMEQLARLGVRGRARWAGALRGCPGGLPRGL
jgi:hypothetical protein